MTSSEESGSFDDPWSPNGRSVTITSPPPLSSSPNDARARSPRFFDFGRKREPSRKAVPTTSENTSNDNQRSFLLLVKENEWLFQNVLRELTDLRSEWEKERIKGFALDYVQATQDQCNFLVKSFLTLARFDSNQRLIADNPQSASEEYKTLLVVLEKLYLAMVELGFLPTDKLQRTLLEVSFHVMPFDRFVAAIDQDILTLTLEFVQQVIHKLDKEDPKSYAIGEQLILMLRDVSPDVQSGLFDAIGNNRAKAMSAQLHVARSFWADRRQRSGARHETGGAFDEIPIDEFLNVNNNQNGVNSHSRLVEQAAVTFYRDCFQRNVLDNDELSIVRLGLLTLASSAP